MKHVPLAVQIWFVFAGITLVVTLLLALLFPWTLRHFFTREVFQNIESVQESLLDYNISLLEQPGLRNPVKREMVRQNIRTVNHAVFLENGVPLAARKLPVPFIQTVRNDIRSQAEDIKRYTKRVQNETVFYVIRKETVRGKSSYLVSYVWDSYLNDLVRTLFRRLVLIMVIVLFVSWIPCLLLARYLTRPLVQMEKHVKRIADRDWHEPLVTKRRDEIGRLARSIERMRIRLVSQDEVQQSFLQHVSHELKTPVMVIRSYAQSILDGIYPKGDLPGTVQVIDDEAERLEKRIRGLLYMTKLDYLETREQKRQPIRLDVLVNEAVERLRWRRSDVAWETKGEAVTITGDQDQWGVLVENLLDNQTRYAEKRIFVSLARAGTHAILQIGNDGPPIDEGKLDSLFNQFEKGEKGEFGLGLAIVKRIARLHQAEVQVRNEPTGVSFIIRIPVMYDEASAATG